MVTSSLETGFLALILRMKSVIYRSETRFLRKSYLINLILILFNYETRIPFPLSRRMARKTNDSLSQYCRGE